MRHLLSSSVGILLSFAAAAAETGVVAGRVITRDGTPLPQVVLTLRGPSGAHTVVSGPEGRFRAALPPGSYEVESDTPGLLVASPRLDVAAGEQSADLRLEPAPVRERVVVAATRGEAVPSTLGVATSILDRERIEQRAAPALLDLFRELPGLDVARTGGVGAQGSAFLRGGESRFARVLVDGVPVNQPGGLYDLGSALPFELERVEVVRGAASSLYGTDALAGVVHLVTRRPAAGQELRAAAEGGSLAWLRAEGGFSGRSGRFDWNLGAQHLATDNEQPNSAFDETEGALSVGSSLGADAAARLVVRAFDSSLGTPGQTAYGRPDLDASFERRDVASGLEVRAGRGSASHLLRLGFATTDQLSLNPEDSGAYVPSDGEREGVFTVYDFASPDGFRNDTTRLSAGYQLEAQLGGRHLVTAGAELERETGTLGAPTDLLEPVRTNVGAYAQDRVVIGRRAYLTLGGRVERNGSYGTRAVPRAALALRLRDGRDATTLRTSAGAGIKEPDLFQSYGASFFAQGNPDLEPERSRTFDLGIEQRLLAGRLRAEATAYHHEYRDQIAYQVVDFTTFEGTYVNLGRTRARGLELGLEAAPSPHVTLSAEYTWLDGEILESGNAFDPVYAEGRSLLRRPEHSGSLGAFGRAGRFSGGVNLFLVGRRADSDFLGLGLTENPGYARLDARVRVDLGRGFEALLVGENLADRRYQEALGYPALGRSVRAAVRFSARR
ncbi:MAG TPA: TonB-dependent receptor [Vicinamibacteria bacterium]|nr:TonB-dependent receptor [Vicinamibacteria bacterium]